MSYTKPGLPNFCNIGNSSDRNNWNQNKNKDNRNKSLNCKMKVNAVVMKIINARIQILAMKKRVFYMIEIIIENYMVDPYQEKILQIL